MSAAPPYSLLTRGPRTRTRIGGNDDLVSLIAPEVGIYLLCTIVCSALWATGGALAVTMIAPIVLTVTPAVANFLMVRRDRNMLVSALFAFRLAIMVFLGLGGLYDSFAPEEVRHPTDWVLYATTQDEAAKVFVVWLVGMTLTMAGAAVAMKASTGVDTEIRAGAEQGRASWQVAALAWLVTFSIDSRFGIGQSLGTSGGMPTSFYSLLTAVELTSLFFLGRTMDQSRGSKVVCAVAALASIVVGLLLQNKSIVIAPMLIVVLGYLSARFTTKRVLIGTAVLVTTFVQINPVVIYARDRQSRDYGELGGGSLSERAGYISDYLAGDRTDRTAETNVMDRLNYVMPASFVIAQFDNGVPNDELAGSAYMLVPRFLWPEKPITTGAGLKVNLLMGIESVNQIAVTVFADIYWNLGWAGLLLTFVMGAFLGASSVVSQTIMRNGDWLMMPFVLGTFRVALGADGNFTAGILIPAVLCIALYWVLRLGRLVLAARHSGSSRGLLGRLQSRPSAELQVPQ